MLHIISKEKNHLKHFGPKPLCAIMSYHTNEDNIYAVGTMITAREAPAIKLEIMKYYQRIYYCSIVGNETAKQKAYFERELVVPSK
jgi:hypothetical protein